MKLRNKKTGEIATLTLSTNGEDMIIMGNDMYAHITKLSELKDYEDYEPTGYWYIDFDGDILSCVEPFDDETEEKRKAIGNYFETQEEAEKAVEKLKAWKRLKDKGFKFEGWVDTNREFNDIMFSLLIEHWDDSITDDLTLLFDSKNRGNS